MEIQEQNIMVLSEGIDLVAMANDEDCCKSNLGALPAPSAIASDK